MTDLEKKDIYGDKERYFKFKEETLEFGIPEISKINSKLILNHLSDMEQGRNISRVSKRGARSFIRLNSIRFRLVFLARLLEERKVKDFVKLKEETLCSLFNDMRTGKIKKSNGQVYKSTADYEKVFNAFWNWLIKIKRKEGIHLETICEDLDKGRDENKFVHFNKELLEKMMPYFSQDEQVRLLFMFDTIIRPPGELLNIKVSDVNFDEKPPKLTIRDEIAKTYGRAIKLLLCAEELKKYIERNKLKDDNFLFDFSPKVFNNKLKKISKEVFGEKMTLGGSKYPELTMYDFRHSGACHWRTGAYKSKIDSLMYRGGWTNLEMLNYYTKKIGMKDSIEKDDLLIGVDKHELEKKMEELQKRLDEQQQKQEKMDKLNEEISKRISELSPKQIKEFMYFKKK